MNLKVSVIGLGYVGLPLAMAAQFAGHNVIGIEINKSLVNNLNDGKSQIEDISSETLSQCIKRGFRATTDFSTLSSADVIVICVPTPLTPAGKPDLTFIHSAGTWIAKYLHRNQLVILESTSYPGTTSEFLLDLLLAESKFEVGLDFNLAFSPERIDPGNKDYKLANTPKVVGGHTTSCGLRAAQFYGTFIGEVIMAKGTREAELSKLIENTYRHVNIALMNELAQFSHELGIDLWDAIRCASSKPFGFQAFYPGPGIGGHCIPIDPNYLSSHVLEKLNRNFTLIEAAEKINKSMPEYIVKRAIEAYQLSDMKSEHKLKVLLLGVSYKKNSSDTRETPARRIHNLLVMQGYDVGYYDPNVKNWDAPAFTVTEEVSLKDALRNYDMAILLQAHEDFDFQLLESSGCVILDTRGVIKGKLVFQI
jgi:UDP-N-acetyl-D-glucosamine dehydrogenase